MRRNLTPEPQLERLPNGEYALLRPELDAAISDADRIHQQPTNLLERGREDRVAITDKGRRALEADRRARAMEALFGQPWPTVTEDCRLEGVA